MLRAFSRQYNKYGKLKTMLKNNLISLLDQTFPGVNELFKSPPRKSDGHEKWLDFATQFWHCKCVYSLTQKAFYRRGQKNFAVPSALFATSNKKLLEKSLIFSHFRA